MPKQVYVKGIGFVRAGSYATKNLVEKWRLVHRQLDALPTTLMRLERLLFVDLNTIDLLPAEREYGLSEREYSEERIIWKLEEIRDWCNLILGKFPKQRRLKALENVNGRTPEEAAL